MQESITLNFQTMEKYNLTTSESILLEYLKSKRDNVLYANKTLNDLPTIFNKKDTLYRCYVSLSNKRAIKSYNLSYIDTYNSLNECNSEYGCKFCGSNKSIHKHHYPIKKSMGGIETIKLCKKCHIIFHSLSDYKHSYKILECEVQNG